MDKMKKVPEPVGKFLLESGKGALTQNGMVYTYSEVCYLLKEYVKHQNTLPSGE